MERTDIFGRATKQKLRYHTIVGLISTEDLWDLPLTTGKTTLNDVAKLVAKQIKDEGEGDFVGLASKSAKLTELNLKLNVVKAVIDEKLDDQKASTERENKNKQRRLIKEIMNEKQNDALKSKSYEELQKLLEE